MLKQRTSVTMNGHTKKGLGYDLEWLNFELLPMIEDEGCNCIVKQSAALIVIRSGRGLQKHKRFFGQFRRCHGHKQTLDIGEARKKRLMHQDSGICDHELATLDGMGNVKQVIQLPSLFQHIPSRRSRCIHKFYNESVYSQNLGP